MTNGIDIRPYLEKKDLTRWEKSLIANAYLRFHQAEEKIGADALFMKAIAFFKRPPYPIGPVVVDPNGGTS